MLHSILDTSQLIITYDITRSPYRKYVTESLVKYQLRRYPGIRAAYHHSKGMLAFLQVPDPGPGLIRMGRPAGNEPAITIHELLQGLFTHLRPGVVTGTGQECQHRHKKNGQKESHGAK
jgi:hypothetical protein